MNRLVVLLVVLAMTEFSAMAGDIEGTLDCGSNCGNFVVYVDGVDGDFNGEGTSVVFDQKGKIYIPHVLPILAGTVVKMKNSDPFLHNVHAYNDKETVFNIAIPTFRKSVNRPFVTSGVYLILCDVHPEMNAYIVVLENPFFSSVGDDGSYLISGVPEGDYTLVLLDPEEGDKKSIRKPVMVAGESVRASF